MTKRRGNKPTRPPKPFKPIPVVTEKYKSKAPSSGNAKLSLSQRFMKWVRRLFRRRKKRRVETKTFKSKWQKEDRIQAIIDYSIHRAKKKARNRRNRKQARALHQIERRQS
ncbi:hypothetical protein KAR91_07090 [Candidatus Pacearchaeota archaeon]|nr:hypothetical protein [Candidatus Pacearchaeota archaeon]